MDYNIKIQLYSQLKMIARFVSKYGRRVSCGDSWRKSAQAFGHQSHEPKIGNVFFWDLSLFSGFPLGPGKGGPT